MCGICGRINILTNNIVTSAQVKKMTKSLNHRGPDDNGTWINNNVGLGHCRLSIIDLSKNGHQPMSDQQQRIWLTFNGEIYNFQEIKNKLIEKGHSFTSNTDSEVIIYAYKQWGVNCLQYFRGMFSFAIYDLNKDLLFAARDRIGKKPFKYYYDGKTFIFASEIKSILTQKEVKKELDNDAVKQFIYWGFIPSPKTGFKNIYKLPPAHYLLLKKGKVTVKKYWDLKPKHNFQRSEEETIKQLRELVEESVKLRMISDVPIGAFLSGGIDSAIIVGIMSQLSPKPINTYTIGFKNWKDSEVEPARITAKMHRTKHREFVIDPDIKNTLATIIAAYDEPIGDVSIVPTYLVSKTAAKYVKVVLNGEGGDENFIGYSNYREFLKAKKLEKLSSIFHLSHLALKPLTTFLYKYEPYQRLLRLSNLLRHKAINRYPLYARGYLNLFELDSLFHQPFNLQQEFNNFLNPNAPDEISAIINQDISNILPDGLMARMDIASMQEALEARSPLLDHKVVEFAATIPTAMKYKYNNPKYIFKKAFADLIPDEILKLPKRGFIMPVNIWFKNELKNLLVQTLNNEKHPLYSIISHSKVTKLLKLNSETNLDYSPILWKLFILFAWYNFYFFNKQLPSNDLK